MTHHRNRRAGARRTVALIALTLACGLMPGHPFARFEPTARAAATFVVTNTGDFGPGSLRQAILDANAAPGLDTITFNIGGPSRTIKPVLSLPSITDPVVIDGTTQPGFAGTPVVELNGANSTSNGLSIGAPGCTVRGLIINGFDGTGISIGSAGGGSRVEGCYIGTDANGNAAVANFGPGVSILSSNNVIGGTTPAARNVISGNSDAGVQLELFCCTGTNPTASGNVIQGNYIGLNAAGTAALPNQREGVVITTAASDASVSGNVVGGTAPGAGNVISGNRFDGVVLGSFQTTGNLVQGNLIGTDATGSFSIPNDGDGVRINLARNNVVGGTEPGARNVISGNGRDGSGTGGGNGVSVASTGNIVRGNLIGVNAAGNAPLRNLLHGVTVAGTNNAVGGAGAGEGNVIAFNGFDGIDCANPSASGNSFRGNSIFSNGFIATHPSNATIGIDLGGFSVTPNDAGDADTGANNLQNFPVINSVNAGPNSVNVKGTLNSTANTAFDLDFYANSVCDASGFGEGARRVGSASVVTDGGGDASFDLTFPVSLPPNQILTATATDPSGNTSEFSQCSATSPSVGSVGFSSTAVTVGEGDGVASFVLNRVGGSSGPLTVNFAVTGNTATAGSDFTPTQGALTFADGETSKMFTVPILEDNVDEPFETVRATLSTSGDLDTLGPQSTATLTIIDNDPTPSASVGDISAAEGDSGTTDFNFPLTLSGPSSRAVTVNFATADGTAVGGGNDYFLPVSNSVTIPPGQTSATITIKVIGDTNVEPDETFFINLTGATGATIARGQGQGTILNDDSTPSASLSINDVSVVEGNSGTTDAVFTVTLSAATNKTVTVDAGTMSDTAGVGTDFRGTASTLTFAPGETSKTFAVPVIGDNIFEGNERFEVGLRNPVNALVADGEGVCTIIDDDAQPTLSVNDITVTEGDSGQKDAVFTVTLSGPSANTVFVVVNTAAGTAAANEDFSEIEGTAVIAPGLTSTQVTVPVIGDTITEPDESFFLNLSNPTGATIARGQGVCTIKDNESASATPTVQFAARLNNVSEGAGSIRVVVTRSGDPSLPVSVNYATRSENASNAASDRSDYTLSLGTLRFAAGETSKSFTVLITDDGFVERDEFITILLSDPAGGATLGQPSLGLINIVDNDTSPSTANPIDGPPLFVRQHYHDFLNREPDASGLQFWVNEIESCGSDAACREVKRINVSAAFFLSIEFQETGYLVERIYKSAYGDATNTIPDGQGGTVQISVPVIRLQEFLPDTQEIGQGIVVGQGDWQSQLENNKRAFALEFVQRPRFTSAFPSTMTADAFVTKLDQNAGGVLSAQEKSQLVASLGATPSDSGARAQVLRSVAEDADLRRNEFNRAFVLMQYYGYLRRNPDDAPDADFRGWKFWLSKLNQFNGDFVSAEMVKAFISSAEYRQRFGAQ